MNELGNFNKRTSDLDAINSRLEKVKGFEDNQKASLS